MPNFYNPEDKTNKVIEIPRDWNSLIRPNQDVNLGEWFEVQLRNGLAKKVKNLKVHFWTQTSNPLDIVKYRKI